MSVIDTGGLPYEITFVLHKSYMLTANVDVSDGLANGAMGKLVHIDLDDAGDVMRIWLVFAEAPKTGEKIRRKVSAYVQANNIVRAAVPITQRTSTIALNNNRTIVAKCRHFPIVSACAITIHKSQGGTFTEIVYEYEKTHSQQLLYVALSRVTSIDGLYIVTSANNNMFYHGRRTPASLGGLQEEFRRLSLNKLETIDRLVTSFITSRSGLSIFSFNCQSLKAHVADLNDTIVRKSNILLFSETWLSNDEKIEIPNFDCVVQFKRPAVRAGGVAIYRNCSARTGIVTSHIDIHLRQGSALAVNLTDVGEICAVRCMLPTQQTIIIVAIYITPNKSIAAIIQFIHEVMLADTAEGATLLKSNNDKIPMILSGDFNVNFATPSAQPLIEFLNEKFNLKMNNNPKISTTKSGTTIDGVFARYLENLETTTYISYFGYHKPLISVLDDEKMDIDE